MSPINIDGILSPEQRIELVNSHFKLGSVFKFFCNKANKEKRLILIGFKYDKSQVAFVHINSEINTRVFHSPALQNENVPLSPAESRPYIDHDCYVNCSDLIIRGSEEIYNLIHKNLSVHLGHLDENDYKNIRTKVCESRVIRRDRKKEFGVFIAPSVGP